MKLTTPKRNLSLKSIFILFLFIFSFSFPTLMAQCPDSAVFSYTGSTTIFTVPCGVSSITIKAWGAGGGGGGTDGNIGGVGGGGAFASSSFSVSPGQQFTIQVGGGGGVGGGCVTGTEPGPGGYGYGSGGAGGTAGTSGCSGSGGGGGGGTFVFSSASIVLAAGGGGGGGGAGNIGGANGGLGGGGGQNGFASNQAAGGTEGASGNYNGTAGTARNGSDGGNAGGGGGGYLGGLVGAQPTNGQEGAGGGGGGGSSYGSIVVNGNSSTHGYSAYTWLPAGTAMGGLDDQTYGTNPGGGGYVIVEYIAPVCVTVVGTNPTCAGDNNGVATATATGVATPYTYAWSTSPVQTTAVATGLSAGSYTITVHDNNGCSATAAVTLTAAPLSISIASHANATACLPNGTATANAATGGTPPYTYSWLPSGGSNLTASNLSAGTYTIHCYDPNGCSGSTTVVITAIPMSITMASHANATACLPNGTATANAATGGTPAYTYAWTPSGGTNLTASGLSAGTYTITASDPNGCSATTSVIITAVPMSISIASSISTGSCNSSGTATANTPAGGTPPYTYAWTPNGGTNLMASGLSAGTYTITAHDPNSCSATASVTITQAPVLQFTGATSFSYTGSIQKWTVPVGITSITVTRSWRCWANRFRRSVRFRCQLDRFAYSYSRPFIRYTCGKSG